MTTKISVIEFLVENNDRVYELVFPLKQKRDQRLLMINNHRIHVEVYQDYIEEVKSILYREIVETKGLPVEEVMVALDEINLSMYLID